MDSLWNSQKIQENHRKIGLDITYYLKHAKLRFNFARYARIWFAKGDTETKRAIFACLGSHLIIKDRKLALTIKKPFKFIFEGLPKAEEELARLEPLKFGSNISNYELATQKFPILSGIVNDVSNCHEITWLFLSWMNCIIPFAMEIIFFNIDLW